MGVKKTKAEHGDRVRWGDRMGTIIDTMWTKFAGVVPPNFGVLPDLGPHRHQSWPKDECVVLDDRPAGCPRCGVAGHKAQQCQAGYLAWKQGRASSSNQVAQRPTPQPVATTPVTDWAVDF